MALHVEGSRDEQPHAGGDSMPLSQGLLPEVGPWRKSLHSFAGACGLSMGVWEFLVWFCGCLLIFLQGQTSICNSKLSV